MAILIFLQSCAWTHIGEHAHLLAKGIHVIWELVCYDVRFEYTVHASSTFILSYQWRHEELSMRMIIKDIHGQKYSHLQKFLL